MHKKGNEFQLDVDELLNVVKDRILQTQDLIKTEENMWIGTEKCFSEQYGMTRIQWPIASKYSELWNSCNKQVVAMNRTGNCQREMLHKLTHAIYQSR